MLLIGAKGFERCPTWIRFSTGRPPLATNYLAGLRSLEIDTLPVPVRNLRASTWRFSMLGGEVTEILEPGRGNYGMRMVRVSAGSVAKQRSNRELQKKNCP